MRPVIGTSFIPKSLAGWEIRSGSVDSCFSRVGMARDFLSEKQLIRQLLPKAMRWGHPQQAVNLERVRPEDRFLSQVLRPFFA